MPQSTYRESVDTSPHQDIAQLCQGVADCHSCPRLVQWRQDVAREKRRSYQDEDYWGRGVPGFGDADARIVVVGLAPAAHGGNRTGRIFTGDRSGDWLFASLYRCGLANQPTSTGLEDGLHLTDIWITAAVKCAPPVNRPTIEERDRCRDKFLTSELQLLSQKQVIVCLGKFAYDVVASVLGMRSRPAFGHGVETQTNGITVVCSYHPSQQNTFTGRLTVDMLDQVFTRAVFIAENSSPH